MSQTISGHLLCDILSTLLDFWSLNSSFLTYTCIPKKKASLIIQDLRLPFLTSCLDVIWDVKWCQMYLQLQSCHHHHCHQQTGRPWSLCRSEPWHRPWSSAGTAYRKSTGLLLTPQLPVFYTIRCEWFITSLTSAPPPQWSRCCPGQWWRKPSWRHRRTWRTGQPWRRKPCSRRSQQLHVERGLGVKMSKKHVSVSFDQNNIIKICSMAYPARVHYIFLSIYTSQRLIFHILE